MQRQSRPDIKLDLNKNNIQPVIDYDGSYIKDHYIDSETLNVYKRINENTFQPCYKYLNRFNGKKYSWKKGYYKVKINKRLYNLHWLLARVFVPGYEPGLEVDHIDNDSSNNKIENLRWITRSENTKKRWDSLSPDKYDEYIKRYSNGIKKAHSEGKYKEHLEKLHEQFKKRG